MSILFPEAQTRRIYLGPTERVVSADLLATAITCIADLMGHIEGTGRNGGRVMQFDERITIESARKVIKLLIGDDS